jgi:putative ABC transport system permease protein
VIYRYKLIELFTAAKEGQRPVKTSRVGALLALVILVAGYAVGLLWQQETFIFNMALTLLLSVVGTFLFFRYVMGAVMNMLR